jgi:hypothetical protein
MDGLYIRACKIGVGRNDRRNIQEKIFESKSDMVSREDHNIRIIKAK